MIPLVNVNKARFTVPPWRTKCTEFASEAPYRKRFRITVHSLMETAALQESHSWKLGLYNSLALTLHRPELFASGTARRVPLQQQLPFRSQSTAGAEKAFSAAAAAPILADWRGLMRQGPAPNAPSPGQSAAHSTQA